MISHRQINWNVLNTVIHDLTHDDVYLCVFPLFHAGGLFAYMSSQVVFGNTSILTRQFDPQQVLELIERERVTVFAAVPTMYQMLTQAPNWETADLSSLRFCTSGGAPLPVPLVEKYGREKGVRFKQGFGMTEFGPGLFALPAEDAIRKAGSIGRPNFFVDVRVVDDDNQPLGPNEVGELVLKGPSGCSGYWNNPEATAAVVDDEGWFHTGDMVLPRRGMVLSTSWTARRTCSSRAARTSIRPRSKRCSTSTRRCTCAPSSACPTENGARLARHASSSSRAQPPPKRS